MNLKLLSLAHVDDETENKAEDGVVELLLVVQISRCTEVQMLVEVADVDAGKDAAMEVEALDTATLSSLAFTTLTTMDLNSCRCFNLQ